MPSFDPVVDAYEASRPDYPEAIFDALGPLDGLRVIEGGAGTGIATRALRARGAEVIALDIGEAMLGRNDGARMLADAARAPLRDGCADLVCFAQAWHWLDMEVASREMARVLREGGRWAAWWNHPREDGEPWFDAYWEVIEAATPAHRSHRDTDWSSTVDPAHFDTPLFTEVPWARDVPLDVWLTDERSKSYIGLQPNGDEVLAQLERILRSQFGDGPVRIRYATWLWQARRR